MAPLWDILYEKIWGICKNRLPLLIKQLEEMGVDDPPSAEDGS